MNLNRKSVKFAFLVLAGLLIYGANPSWAAPILEEVKVIKSGEGVTVDLAFDGPYSSKGIHPVYERNFVQFVLNGVGVKAAKMVPVADSLVEKVFVYQYQPGVARVRLILREDAQAAKGRINIWNSKSEGVRFLVKSQIKKGLIERLSEAPALSKSDEEKILKNVIQNTKPILSENPGKNEEKAQSTETAAVKTAETDSKSVTTQAVTESENKSVGIKTDPSRHFVKMILALLAVVGLFVGCAFLVKNYANRIDLKKLPFGKKERLIQVIASHRLGKTQAISLVKITGEYMVVGVSGENMSLIAKLGRDVDVEKYLEDRYWGGAFEKHLHALSKPAKAQDSIDSIDPIASLVRGARTGEDRAESHAQSASADSRGLKYRYDGARDLGMSAGPAVNSNSGTDSDATGIRAAIREKITKLKPLS